MPTNQTPEPIEIDIESNEGFIRQKSETELLHELIGKYNDLLKYIQSKEHS